MTRQRPGMFRSWGEAVGALGWTVGVLLALSMLAVLAK